MVKGPGGPLCNRHGITEAAPPSGTRSDLLGREVWMVYGPKFQEKIASSGESFGLRTRESARHEMSSTHAREPLTRVTLLRLP